MGEPFLGVPYRGFYSIWGIRGEVPMLAALGWVFDGGFHIDITQA